jgi:amino acid transporter
MYAGMDGAVHLAEESTDAARAVPRALLSTWIVGFATSFIVSIAAMYSVQDFEQVANTPTGYVTVTPSSYIVEVANALHKVPHLRVISPSYALRRCSDHIHGRHVDCGSFCTPGMPAGTLELLFNR